MSMVHACDLCGQPIRELDEGNVFFDLYLGIGYNTQLAMCTACLQRPIADLQQVDERLSAKRAKLDAAFDKMNQMAREAPHGRNDDGTPKAPYGYTKAGTPRRKPAPGQDAA
jgi:hypothetical protein